MSDELRGRYQDSPITFYNRYPILWNRAASILAKEDPSILIVGCSTGEECFTALAYFPGATIVATEADELTLRFAKLRHSHPQILYVPASDGLPYGPFDLVCCNSVLCEHPGNLNKQTLDRASFDKFERITEELASKVAPRGLLMLHNAEHRFSETEQASRFSAATFLLAQSVAVFDKEGNRTDDKAVSIWRRDR